MNNLKKIFEESERSITHKKLSLGLANVAVIKAWDTLPEPIHKCPDCDGNLIKKSFWNWFRSGYNSEGYDLSEGESLTSMGSTLMCGMISNKCSKCGKIIRTKDLDKGIEKFNSGKAYKSIKQMEECVSGLNVSLGKRSNTHDFSRGLVSDCKLNS